MTFDLIVGCLGFACGLLFGCKISYSQHDVDRMIYQAKIEKIQEYEPQLKDAQNGLSNVLSANNILRNMVKTLTDGLK